MLSPKWASISHSLHPLLKDDCRRGNRNNVKAKAVNKRIMFLFFSFLFTKYYTYELTVAMATFTRPVQAQSEPNPIINKGGRNGAPLLSKELLAISLLEQSWFS